MRKTIILSGALMLAALPISAQTTRWNDRPTVTWAEEAPRVRVWIDGERSVGYGAPVRVRFEVSDNAYVTVVRVDDDGRMTILFPYSRNSRSAARRNYIHDVRNPRLGGNFAFAATDRMSGYVFAIASFAPLDLSSFENRDYSAIGGYSQFTRANRSIARRPDVFIDRFAARVLWDVDTPYDYDVDYYHPIGYMGSTAMAMCGTGAMGMGGMYQFIGMRTYLAQLSSWDRMGGYGFFYPYSLMCRDYYRNMSCISMMTFSPWGCTNAYMTQTAQQDRWGAVGGGKPVTEVSPNEGVIRGGLFTPTPVPIPVAAGGDPPPQERPIGRFDQVGSDLDNLKSIPERATRKMKEDDARREKEATGAPARAGFDRTEASNKPAKGVADNDAGTRVQPPPRQPTKSKGVSEPQRDTRSKGGFGTTSRPSDYSGPDRTSRPVETKSTGTGAGSGGSIQSAPTGDKKKPPQNQ